MSDERNEAEPIELGYIEDLGDMISVQEGSTVSRTVMQKAGGNVVLFSFDTGEELSEHTAAMPVFVQTLKGCGWESRPGLPEQAPRSCRCPSP